jgi:cytochrome c553
VRQALAAMLLGPFVAAAATPPPPPAKAQPCATCHGPQGLATVPDAPNLAGQPQGYLADQLKAFRDGKRIHPVMNVVARPLTDADIEQLAAWYASIAVEVRAPPP